jgi:NAD(P)H dehydrogenase (quinone)
MRTIETTPPIPYRQQNAGDYLIPSMQLRTELGDPSATSFALHLNGAGKDG